ncbi:hypothetical protein EZS27_007733 [termite gut metagenome]|uniref:Uncharacterized protein n=1 Tax=termite gut metagenome TaxID=433724 RepID=A0A5J4SHD6_9ZZZZ
MTYIDFEKKIIEINSGIQYYIETHIEDGITLPDSEKQKILLEIKDYFNNIRENKQIYVINDFIKSERYNKFCTQVLLTLLYVFHDSKSSITQYLKYYNKVRSILIMRGLNKETVDELTLDHK